MGSCRRRVVVCWIVAAAFASGTPQHADDLTPAERRGRHIYLHGSSPSGAPITALLGTGDRTFELPGEAVVCGSCHGSDGRGRPESGVVPSDVRWKHLARSYGHVHPGGVEHPAFGDASVKRYLTTGRFPNGQPGDPAMPVYRMSDRDLDDLVAYLKRVGDVLDPGLGRSSIRIGTVLPAEGPLAETGVVIHEVLEAYLDEVNRTGGIYGRRLELDVCTIGGTPEEALATLEAWLASGEPFAIVSPFTPGVDGEILSSLSQGGIPVVGPLTLRPLRSYRSNRNVYYLYPGLGEQVEALVRYASTRLQLSHPRLAILAPADESQDDVVRISESAARSRGWNEIVVERFDASTFEAIAVVGRLRGEHVDVVLSLALDSELRPFLHEARRVGWHPVVLSSGALAAGALVEAPGQPESRLYMAFPTLPQDRKPWALEAVSRLLRGHDLPRSHHQALVSAYSAATIVTETLRRSGRDVSRSRLTSELERLYEFDTGLIHPVTFTSNRRIGARGAYVVAAESLAGGTVPQSVPWIEVEGSSGTVSTPTREKSP